MKRTFLLGLGLGLLVLVPALAVAQRPASELKPDQAAQMYEDIEIMRRLLLRSLGASTSLSPGVYYPSTTTGAVNAPAQYFIPSTTMAGQQGLFSTRYVAARVAPAVEGVYVKGHGVLYTVTMAPPRGDPRPDGSRPTPKPENEWERLRSQLRGEKIEPPDTSDKKEPTVGDRILAALAKNGHNFSQLPADETLTVVVVFRSDAVRTATTWPTDLSDSTVRSVAPAVVHQPATVKTQTDRDHELLGDLHVKNGQINQAIEAYTRALQLVGESQSKAVSEPIRNMDRVEELMQKLAQALLKAGKTDEASKLIERLKELSKKSVSEAKSNLPARLTLSASKRLLDQAGQDRINFDEFKKAATVDYQTFPPAKK